MARVKRGRNKKYDWMQTKLNYQLDLGASGGTYGDSVYFDVARGLSLMNRKLIRQGQLFRIKGMRIWSDNDTTLRFKVATIPTNWVARNAWVKGKALWDKLNATVTEDLQGPVLYPKYHDFKVLMNKKHYDHVLGEDTPSQPVPCDADMNLVNTTNAEWQYSQFADSGSTSDSYYVKMLGPHDGSESAYDVVGLITAYGQSRVQPSTDDPIVPSDLLSGPWSQLFGDDSQTSTQVAKITDDNDAPPYPSAVYIGGDVQGGFTVATGTVGKDTSAPQGFTVQNFVAPCGLVRMEIDHSTSWSGRVHVTFDVDILGPMDM